MFVRNAFMQYLGINCGGNWTFELGFFIWVFGFLLKKSGLIFKSPVATLLRPHCSIIRHMVDRHVVQCHYLSVLICCHVMHQNTSVSSVNKHCQ